MPRVSVIVINWNTNVLLLRCLASLGGDPARGQWQIIAMDNGSEDDPSTLVRELCPWAQVVRSERNLGFSAGNNLAAEQARGEYLIFLNADTEVPEGAINRLADFLDGKRHAGAVGPRLVGTDGRPQPSSGLFPGALSYLRDALYVGRALGRLAPFRRWWPPWLDGEGAVRVDYVPGAALMIRREAFEAAGGWPEAYFFYGEDAELGSKLTDGPTPHTYLLRDAEVVHLHGGSVLSLPVWKALAANRAALLFVARNRSGLSLAAMRVAVALGNLPRLAACLLALPVAAALGKGRQLAERVWLYARVIGLACSPRRAFEQNAPTVGRQHG